MTDQSRKDVEEIAKKCLQENCVDWKQRPDIVFSITDAITKERLEVERLEKENEVLRNENTLYNKSYLALEAEVERLQNIIRDNGWAIPDGTLRLGLVNAQATLAARDAEIARLESQKEAILKSIDGGTHACDGYCKGTCLQGTKLKAELAACRERCQELDKALRELSTEKMEPKDGAK